MKTRFIAILAVGLSFLFTSCMEDELPGILNHGVTVPFTGSFDQVESVVSIKKSTSDTLKFVHNLTRKEITIVDGTAESSFDLGEEATLELLITHKNGEVIYNGDYVIRFDDPNCIELVSGEHDEIRLD